MSLPANPGQRDDHYRRPPSLRNQLVEKIVEEVTGAVDSAVGGRGGFMGGATSGAAGAGFSRGGGGGPFQMKLWAGHGADIDRVVEPAPWLPTSVGAVRASSVESFTVESYDDSKKMIYAVQLRLHSGEVVGLRDVFVDDLSLAVWVDTAFPGAAFLTAWPDALDQR